MLCMLHRLFGALLRMHRWIEALILWIKVLVGMLSRIETLIGSLLLHPRIKALLLPWIETALLHPWVVPRCIPHSLQPALPRMCIGDSHSNTSKTARSLFAEVICTWCNDLVWVRISVCVTQFSPPESTFCVSVWRGCCESWWTYWRSIAL